MSGETIKSIGIDIGTSTSKFMISELKLGRVSSHFTLPRFDIIERKIIYVSEMIPTPLKNEEEIDLPPLVEWLEKEYHATGLSLPEIKSGAVIITGETAIKKNADALLHYLAERAGDFVVAIAGASLEGVLAGRGSGAYEHSLGTKRVIANIDIGGGTANVAFFQHGKVLDTITFHVGGRLIELDSAGDVRAVSHSLRPWLSYRKIPIKAGSNVTFSELQEIASMLCKDMLDVLFGKRDIPAILHTPLQFALPVFQEVIVSGGVGRLMRERQPGTLAEAAKYHDFGPLLAGELSKVLAHYPVSLVKAAQTSSATVIGVGMQSTKLSGATITINPEWLPLRNLPVVKLSNMAEIESVFLKGKEWFSGPFAVGIGDLPRLSYLQLKQFAETLGRSFMRFFPDGKVFVAVCEKDMAKALGQALRLQFDFEVICIDQVEIDHGDYIDIGQPLHDTMVPVVVKTLAFHA